MSRTPVTQERPASQVNAENPWPGLAPFSEDLAAFFHGRRREVEDLFRRVRLNPLTVLYGQSGLGKTSLLQAALAPRLRDAEQLPVFIRIDYGDEELSPRQQIAKAIRDAAAAVGAAAEPIAEEEGLWEYFHRKRPSITHGEGDALPVVLAFDQFEELFTHGAERPDGGRFVRELLDELASLVENRPPDRLQGDFERDPRRVAKYNYERQDYRILINLREDFLAHLHDLSERIPSITINNMRLSPLDGERALEAVVKPGGALVTPAVAEKIVRFVAGAGEDRRQGQGGGGRSGARDMPSLTRPIETLVVDPSLLSLFCQALNKKRLVLGAATISPELVSQSSEDILKEFYDSSLAEFPPATRQFIEDELLTPSGFRETLAAETARARLGHLGVSGDVLDRLVEKRLLHYEQRGRDRRVELTHDVLTKVASASRETRLATERERRKVQELEAQEARTRQAVQEAEILARQHEEELAKARRQRRTFAILGLVMTALLVLALAQWRRADKTAADLQASVSATKAEATRADTNAAQARRSQAEAQKNADAAALNEKEARRQAARAEALLADSRRANIEANTMRVAASNEADKANQRLAIFCQYGKTLGTRLSDSVLSASASERLYAAVIAISDSFTKALRTKAPDLLCPLQLQTRFEAIGARQMYNQSRNTRLSDAKRDTLRTVAREHAYDGMRALDELDQRADSEESVSIAAFAHSELANVLVSLSSYDSAARVARRGLEMAARIDPSRDRMAFYRRADLAKQLGTSHAIQNRQDSAHAVFLLGMALADSGKARPGQNREWLDYVSAELQWRLAVVDTIRHRPDSALGHARRMVQEAIAQYTEDRRSEFNYGYLATSYERLGHFGWRAGRLSEARVAFDSAETLRARLAGESSGPITSNDRETAQANLLQLRDTLAALELRHGGDTARAVMLNRRAVALARLMASPAPASVDRRIRLADAFGNLGDAESAASHFDAAIAAYRERVVLDSMLAVESGFAVSDVATLAAAYTSGANAQESAGHYDEAVRWQAEALRRRTQARDSMETHAGTFATLATARRRQASAFLSLGWFELSARQFASSIEHSRRAFALDSTNTYSLPNLFNGLLLAGRPVQADSLMQQWGRRQVEDPQVPFACAAVRDLETVLIPRGAARPDDLRSAEQMALRSSSTPLAECPHRKTARPTP